MPQHAAASGGNGPGTLVFCHANGYPAGTYRQLFDAWRATGWRVEALDKFGHDPAYPVTSNWPRLRDQLVGFIRNTPNFGSGMGAFNAADSAKASTRRVSAGSMMPSSHRRAVP